MDGQSYLVVLKEMQEEKKTHESRLGIVPSPPSLALELNFAQQLLYRLITAYIAPYLHFFSAMYLHHQSTESSTFTVVATTLDGHLRKKKKKHTTREQSTSSLLLHSTTIKVVDLKVKRSEKEISLPSTTELS